MKEPLGKKLFILFSSLVLAGAFWLLTNYLLWGDWEYDQGFYFVVARLMEQGHKPYHDLHMSEQPLMAWSTYLSHRLLNSIWGMQFFMVGYAMLGIAALISIGRSLDSRLTGLLAGLLLATHFDFFRAARTVNPETTSLSLALLAIALAFRYREAGKRVWLILSALALAGSFLLKLFMIVVIIVVGLMLLSDSVTRSTNNQNQNSSCFGLNFAAGKRAFNDLFLWGGVIFLVLFINWVIVGLPGLWEQSILFYARRNAAFAYDFSLNLQTIWKLLDNSPTLLLLAIAGLGKSLLQFKQYGWMIMSWVILTLIFLMTFTPLRDKHVVILIPLLALLAALPLSHLAGLLLTHRADGRKWAAGVILTFVMVLLVVEMSAPFERLAKPSKPLVKGYSETIANGLLKFTSPNDCIITDDPYIAYVSDRLPPPWLSNMSYARFESGSLDLQRMVDLTNQHNCQAVVATFGRIKNGNRPYYDWAKGNFLRVWVVDGREIMVGKVLPNANPDRPITTNFNDQVELLGADWVKSDELTSDKQVYLSLYWKTLRPFDQSYKIFVQLRDDSGQTVASADHEMLDGLLPTQVWPVNLIIKDTTRLIIAQDAPSPGSYTLYIGFYDPVTLERLPVTADRSGENAAVIPDIIIP